MTVFFQSQSYALIFRKSQKYWFNFTKTAQFHKNNPLQHPFFAE